MINMRWDELEEKHTNYRSCKVLFELFLEKFPNLKLDWEKDWNQWTKQILTLFAELGKFFGFEVYLEPKYGILGLDKEPTSEYLVDLCWSFEDEYYRAQWIELALESELSGRDIDSIIEDFNKLVDVKSYVKVGIFCPKLADRDRVMELLEDTVAISGIQFPSERYLVILILYHGKAEKVSKRIEIAGYEINYRGESKIIDSGRFPASIKKK